MRDHWIYGLLAAITGTTLCWTWVQMARQSPMVVCSDDHSGTHPLKENKLSEEDKANTILGSDQPVDEDPDFDIEPGDLGAIAAFEDQRF